MGPEGATFPQVAFVLAGNFWGRNLRECTFSRVTGTHPRHAPNWDNEWMAPAAL